MNVITRSSAVALAAVLAAALGLAPASGRAANRRPAVSLAAVRADEQQVHTLAQAFDLTEHGRDGWFDVVLHPGDRDRLDRLGFEYRILVADLAAADLEARRREAAAQAENPGIRLVYRTLAEYEHDLRRLAEIAPDLVRLFELPFRTHEGRTVLGIELAGDVQAASLDGRPTSMIVGLHHAREWPSGEVTMDFAQDLVASYRAGDSEIRDLLDHVRVLVVPVVNPDGFVRSRETISDFVAPLPGAAALMSEFAYHRKNLRVHNTSPLRGGQGVDVNRNYPYLWGGPGASDEERAQTYFGPGPGSEPEAANLAWLASRNHVLTLVTNHTYSNLVLRPWGHTRTDAPDEARLRALGDAMAAVNGYTSQKGIDLYPTSGTTDDWLYGVTGGFGFTFEIGSPGFFGLGNVSPVECAGFHPQYNVCMPQFYAENRGAFLVLLDAARDASIHSVITGSAPIGTVIRTTKTVTVPLGRAHEGGSSYPSTLEAEIVVGASGTYAWHVNPSPLPATVARVAAGQATQADLERYAITAIRPDGATETRTVLALRGATIEVNF